MSDRSWLRALLRPRLLDRLGVTDRFRGMAAWVDRRLTRYRGLLRAYSETVSRHVGLGPAHRVRLRSVDTRIAVSGVRGKSSAVRWLHDVFHDREYDTYAKITGTRSVSLKNGTEHDIDRDERVALYENERVLRRHLPADVAIIENQGIRPYTTRLVNEQYVEPDVVFVTNVRQDHLGTLGHDRHEIARALARAVPRGSHAVVGDQTPAIRRYLEAELDRRDVTVTHVEIPDEHADVPGAEVVFGVDDVLREVGEPPLSEERRSAYLDELRVEWTQLPGGRVYNAADVNDVESTEAVRRSLVGGDGETVEPLVYLRPDRRGRSASFRRYLDELAAAGLIERARLVGPETTLVAERLDVPTVEHTTDEDPAAVLDGALSDGPPVLLAGNTVVEFMDEMDAVIDERATAARDHSPSRNDG